MSKTYKIKVPIGIDPNGNEIRAKNAKKGIRYYCPSCQGELIYRRGQYKQAHFAHKADPDICDFVFETENHVRAKMSIVYSITRGMTIFVNCRCQRCGTDLKQKLPSSVKRALLEYPLPSGHRADVALLGQDNNLLAVIEVMETHPVDEEKAKALSVIPWAEVMAETVLASNTWEIRTDNFKQALCLRCIQVAEFGCVYPYVSQYRQ